MAGTKTEWGMKGQANTMNPQGYITARSVNPRNSTTKAAEAALAAANAKSATITAIDRHNSPHSIHTIQRHI